MNTQWQYADNGQAFGPLSEDEIKRLIDDGRITSETQVWRQGLDRWMPAGLVLRTDGAPVVQTPLGRDGKQLVVRLHAPLPPCCVYCGQAAHSHVELRMSEVTFKPTDPGPLSVMLAFGPIGLAVYHALKRRQKSDWNVDVRLPVCETHKMPSRRLLFLSLAFFASALPFAWLSFSANIDALILLVFPCIFAGLGCLLYWVFTSRIWPVKMESGLVWFRVFRSAYKDSLPDWHELPQSTIKCSGCGADNDRAGVFCSACSLNVHMTHKPA